MKYRNFAGKFFLAPAPFTLPKGGHTIFVLNKKGEIESVRVQGQITMSTMYLTSMYLFQESTPIFKTLDDAENALRLGAELRSEPISTEEYLAIEKEITSSWGTENRLVTNLYRVGAYGGIDEVAIEFSDNLLCPVLFKSRLYFLEYEHAQKWVFLNNKW